MRGTSSSNRSTTSSGWAEASCSANTLTPMLRMMASRTASRLAISMVRCGVTSAAASISSIFSRVIEPCSRVIRSQPASCFTRTDW